MLVSRGRARCGDPAPGGHRRRRRDHCDQANWANARLTRARTAIPKSDAPRIDMAQFARVVTWDPNVQDGPRWSRAKEFPAEDLFLETDVSPDSGGCYVVPVASAGADVSVFSGWSGVAFAS